MFFPTDRVVGSGCRSIILEFYECFSATHDEIEAISVWSQNILILLCFAFPSFFFAGRGHEVKMFLNVSNSLRVQSHLNQNMKG